MDTIKKGVQTSEFWMVNFYAIMGLISAKMSPELMPVIDNIGYAVMMYIAGRVGVKLAPRAK